MTDLPHFDYPFRFAGTNIVTNDQGTEDDIAACVASVILTHPGDREMLPEFGSPDLLFTQQPIDVAAYVEAVTTWEPRAVATFDQHPNSLDAKVVEVIGRISNRGSTT